MSALHALFGLAGLLLFGLGAAYFNTGRYDHAEYDLTPRQRRVVGATLSTFGLLTFIAVIVVSG